MHALTEDPKVRGVSVIDADGQHHLRLADGWFCRESGHLVQWEDLLPRGPLLTNWRQPRRPASRRAEGDGTMTEFAKGGIIPPDFELAEPTRCLQETNGTMALISARLDRARQAKVAEHRRDQRGYGDIHVKAHYADDGTVAEITVEHADDLVAISTSLLSKINMLHINDDGLFVADTAGEYVYRPVRFAEQGRVVVCERVQ